MSKHIAVHCTYHLRRTIDDDVFQHRMSLCASSFPEDGYYYYPKHVGTVTVHVLINSCRVMIVWLYWYRARSKITEFVNTNTCTTKFY